MPNIDLSILNQRQTPAFYADVFANRPAAGFVGRIFVSTDTFAFYRDNGTGWDLIGGPGTGTVTGTGAAGQVSYWSGASTITGSNDLFWDSVNGHLGVNTNVPGTALDVHHDQPTVAILNQTTATNDVRIGFQNNGVGLWRIGAFYNAGANDFGIFDAVGNIQPVTVKKTTGQVLIGTSTVGSGKLVVASTNSDNGVQIVGASAPSLRIDNAESGPTKRAGLGISTATNNFIQGSADRDFCIFNGSTAAASPILFGIYDAAAVNVQEAARISPARNFIVGTTTDAGQKLQVNGTTLFTGLSKIKQTTTNWYDGLRVFNGSSNTWTGIGNNGSAGVISSSYDNTGSYLPLSFYTSDVERATITAAGNVGIGTTSPSYLLDVRGNNATTQIKTTGTTGSTFSSLLISSPAMTWNIINDDNGGGGKLRFYNDFLVADALNIMKGTNNVLIGTTTDAGSKLQVNGQTQSTRVSYAGLQSICSYSFGPGTSTTINIITQFPELTGLTLGNVWGISGTATNFLSGTAECVMFTISRNSGGGWSAGVIGLSSPTASAILTSVTGSGDTITLNFAGTAYTIVTLQAQVR